jgi:hypothetical protein
MRVPRNARRQDVGISPTSDPSQVWCGLEVMLVNRLGALEWPVRLVGLGRLGWVLEVDEGG